MLNVGGHAAQFSRKRCSISAVEVRNLGRNTQSSNIRQGTTILKWYRLGTRTIRGQKVPVYKWDALNTIINDHRTLFHLPPCNMTEEHYIQFISNLANLNRELITAE